MVIAIHIVVLNQIILLVQQASFISISYEDCQNNVMDRNCIHSHVGIYLNTSNERMHLDVDHSFGDWIFFIKRVLGTKSDWKFLVT
jgi:hypothetical protein